MTDNPLPDHDHVVRYVKPSCIDQSEDGQTMILGSGFVSRPADAEQLSVNWLEILSVDLELALQEVRRISRLTLKRNGRFARLNVGLLKQFVKENTEPLLALDIQHDPLEATEDFPEDPSHALMSPVSSSDSHLGELVGDLIAECVLDHFPTHD